jgi:hypothetical protein
VEEAMRGHGEMQQIARAHRRRYDYRRITAELRQLALSVNHTWVALIMRKDNLLAVHPRAFVVATDAPHALEVYMTGPSQAGGGLREHLSGSLAAAHEQRSLYLARL